MRNERGGGRNGLGGEERNRVRKEEVGRKQCVGKKTAGKKGGEKKDEGKQKGGKKAGEEAGWREGCRKEKAWRVDVWKKEGSWRESRGGWRKRLERKSVDRRTRRDGSGSGS
jgi:hypothetical protein